MKKPSFKVKWGRKFSEQWISFRVVILFLIVFGILNLILDLIFPRLFQEPAAWVIAETIRPWAILLLSAALIYFLVWREIREFKKADRRHASENRLSNVLENITDCVLLVDEEQKILLFNPAAQQVFGYKENEIIGRSLDLILPDDETLGQRTMQERFTAEKSAHHFTGQDQDILGRRKSGVLFPVEISISVLEGGNKSTYTVILRDITWRKQVEDELREKEIQYRSIFEATSDGIMILAQDGTILAANPASCRMVGVTIMNFIGSKASQYLSPEFRTLLPLRPDHIHDENIFRRQAIALRADGSQFNIEIRASLFEYQGEERTLAVIRDVTERAQAFQAMEMKVIEHTHETERRRQVAESLREIVALLNSNQPVDEVLNTITGQAGRLLGPDAAAIHLLEDADGGIQIHTSASVGWKKEELAIMEFWKGEGLVGKVVETHEPVIMPDMLNTGLLRRCEPANCRECEFWKRSARRYRALLVVPLLAGERSLGAISLSFHDRKEFSTEDIDLAIAFANQAALAIENDHLHREASSLAVVKERNRLARELHDSVTQSLYSLTLLTEAARRLVQAGDMVRVESYLARLGETAQQSLKEMRLLVYELRPIELGKEGLVRALQHRVDAVEGRSGVETRLLVEGEIKAGPDVEEGLYRIAMEALNNAIKHAGATNVTIALHAKPDAIEMEIYDNGIGFSLENVKDRGGMGLTTMRERAEQLGAKFILQSDAGIGTLVKIITPLPEQLHS